jgi:hypothetical protein
MNSPSSVNRHLPPHRPPSVVSCSYPVRLELLKRILSPRRRAARRAVLQSSPPPHNSAGAEARVHTIPPAASPHSVVTNNVPLKPYFFPTLAAASNGNRGRRSLLRAEQTGRGKRSQYQWVPPYRPAWHPNPAQILIS